MLDRGRVYAHCADAPNCHPLAPQQLVQALAAGRARAAQRKEAAAATLRAQADRIAAQLQEAPPGSPRAASLAAAAQKVAAKLRQAVGEAATTDNVASALVLQAPQKPATIATASPLSSIPPLRFLAYELPPLDAELDACGGCVAGLSGQLADLRCALAEAAALGRVLVLPRALRVPPKHNAHFERAVSSAEAEAESDLGGEVGSAVLEVPFASVIDAQALVASGAAAYAGEAASVLAAAGGSAAAARYAASSALPLRVLAAPGSDAAGAPLLVRTLCAACGSRRRRVADICAAEKASQSEPYDWAEATGAMEALKWSAPVEAAVEAAAHELRAAAAGAPFATVHARRGDKLLEGAWGVRLADDTSADAVGAALQRAGVPEGAVVYIATDDPGAALLFAPLAPRWAVRTWRDVPALVALADRATTAAPSSTPAFALFAAEKALCARHGAPHLETYCRDTNGGAPAGLARDVPMQHCLARDGKHWNATVA